MRPVATLLLSLLIPTSAESFTGLELYKVCNGLYGRADDNAICLGYLRGYSEGFYLGMFLGRSLEKTGRTPCFPQPPKDNPPDITQVELIVKKFLSDHSDRLTEPSSILVQEALATAFRCRTKPSD